MLIYPTATKFSMYLKFISVMLLEPAVVLN